jgi:hypothetical protein
LKNNRTMTAEEKRGVDRDVLHAIHSGHTGARAIIAFLGAGSGVDRRVLDKSFQRLRARGEIKYAGQRCGWIIVSHVTQAAIA